MPGYERGRQIVLIDRLNEQLAPFRVLTGIEVDILEDGSLESSHEGRTLDR